MIVNSFVTVFAYHLMSLLLLPLEILLIISCVHRLSFFLRSYIETRPIVDGDISTLGYPTVTKPPGFTGNVVTKEEDVSTLGDPTIFGGKSVVNHKSPKRGGPSSEIPKTDGSLDGISTASDR